MIIDMPPAGPPRPLRWTNELASAVADHGYFEGRRACLIDGQLYEEGPEPPAHACTRGVVAEVFRKAFDGCHLRERCSLVLSDDTNPVPDVGVIPGAIRDYRATHPTAAVFVVEVADLSFDFDTTVKADLYATVGVPDYWVIDLANRQLLVFRDPIAGGKRGAVYQLRFTCGPADTVSPLAAPHAHVTVADLLP
jgi:Uma2 family endonuclease